MLKPLISAVGCERNVNALVVFPSLHTIGGHHKTISVTLYFAKRYADFVTT